MDTWITALKAAAQAKDAQEIRRILREIPDTILDIYLKAALVLPSRNPEIYAIIPHIDPNRMLYGGALTAVVAGHVTRELDDPIETLGMLGHLLHLGADPNTSFTPTVAGDEIQPMTLFSLAVVGQLLEPPRWYSVPHLVAMMCRKGLRLEGDADHPSPLQQVIEGIQPAHLLEKRKFDKRVEVGEKALEEEWWRRKDHIYGPIRSIQHQTEEVIKNLIEAGADPTAPLVGHDEALNAVEMLRKYAWQLEDMRYYPRELREELDAAVDRGWEVPEYVLDRHVLLDASCMYFGLAHFIETNYLDIQFNIDRDSSVSKHRYEPGTYQLKPRDRFPHWD